MKKLLSIILLSILIVSCSKPAVKSKGALPPGQVKKLTGGQSAAPYAPGQQKKKSSAAPSRSSGAQKKGN
jgi:hypothetical protein